MNRPRVVVDTNVVISAAMKAGGLEEKIIKLVATREFALYASPAIMAEYETVLSRSKFARIDPTRIAQLVAALKAEATMVTPLHRVSESPHEPDNRFLECAEVAEAEYLITGNTRHFPARWKSTHVVNARELFRLIS